MVCMNFKYLHKNCNSTLITAKNFIDAREYMLLPFFVAFLLPKLKVLLFSSNVLCLNSLNNSMLEQKLLVWQFVIQIGAWLNVHFLYAKIIIIFEIIRELFGFWSYLKYFLWLMNCRWWHDNDYHESFAVSFYMFWVWLRSEHLCSLFALSRSFVGFECAKRSVLSIFSLSLSHSKYVHFSKLNTGNI